MHEYWASFTFRNIVLAAINSFIFKKKWITLRSSRGSTRKGGMKYDRKTFPNQHVHGTREDGSRSTEAPARELSAEILKGPTVVDSYHRRASWSSGQRVGLFDLGG